MSDDPDGIETEINEDENKITLTLVRVDGEEMTVHVTLPQSDPVELKLRPGSTINIPMSQLVPKGYAIVPIN